MRPLRWRVSDQWPDGRDDVLLPDGQDANLHAGDVDLDAQRQHGMHGGEVRRLLGQRR